MQPLLFSLLATLAHAGESNPTMVLETPSYRLTAGVTAALEWPVQAASARVCSAAIRVVDGKAAVGPLTGTAALPPACAKSAAALALQVSGTPPAGTPLIAVNWVFPTKDDPRKAVLVAPLTEPAGTLTLPDGWKALSKDPECGEKRTVDPTLAIGEDTDGTHFDTCYVTVTVDVFGSPKAGAVAGCSPAIFAAARTKALKEGAPWCPVSKNGVPTSTARDVVLDSRILR